jgi:hypothetical protein
MNFYLVTYAINFVKVNDENIKDAIDEIFSYSKKWVFVSVCCRKAIAILPNGYNAHATIESAKWWKELLKPYKNYTLKFSE